MTDLKENKTGLRTLLLLIGMGLMIPCYLFTVGNVILSPYTLYDRSRPALFALTAAFVPLLLLAFRTIDKREAFFARHERAVLAGFIVFYFAAQLLMAQALRFEPKTDAEQCFTAAQLLADEGSFASSERAVTYFAIYPNNWGFVYVLSLIFRFFGRLGWEDRFTQAVLVGSLLFALGLFCGARLCRRLGGVKAQTKMLLLCLTCFPLLYCTTELYTDAFSIAFPTIALCCLVRAADEKGRGMRLLFSFLFILATFVGAQIRFTAIIPSIAGLIWLLLSRRALRALSLSCVMAASLLCGQAALNRVMAGSIDPALSEKSALPVTHFMVMGLPVQEDEGYGQYGDGGWYLFSTSFDNPDERDAALLQELIDRVYTLVRHPNRLLSTLSRKNLSTFGEGTFKLHEIIEGDDYEPDNLVKEVMFGAGALRPAYYHVCTALFLAQMLVACLSCAQAIRRRDIRGAALFIALLGAFLFLCMWETRARYFFQFEMVLLCAGALTQGNLHSRRKS